MAKTANDEKKKRKKGKRGNNEGTVYERSDGRWAAQLTTGYDIKTGRPKRTTLYGKSRGEVAEKLKKALYEQQIGTFVEPSKLTFGEWLLRWLDVYKKNRVKPTTYADYLKVAEDHIIPSLGQMPIQDLRTSHLQEFYNYKTTDGRKDGKDGGMSASKIHLMHVLIGGALKQAASPAERLIPYNPDEWTARPAVEAPEIETYSKEEVRLYLDVAKQHRLYAAFLLDFTTGLRRGEVLGITWKNLDLDTGTLTVKSSLSRVKLAGEEKSILLFGDPKTKSSKRIIPLLPAVVAEVKKHKARQAEDKLFFGQAYEDKNLVFATAMGKPIDPRNFYGKHVRIIKKAGLKHIRVHDIRHTVATILLDEGENVKNVAELFGHANASFTLNRYAHSTPEGKERAINRLGNALNFANQ